MSHSRILNWEETAAVYLDVFGLIPDYWRHPPRIGYWEHDVTRIGEWYP